MCSKFTTKTNLFLVLLTVAFVSLVVLYTQGSSLIADGYGKILQHLSNYTVSVHDRKGHPRGYNVSNAYVTSLYFDVQFVEYGGITWNTPPIFRIFLVESGSVLYPSGLVYNMSGTFPFNKWYWSSDKRLVKYKQKHKQMNFYVLSFVQIWNKIFQHIVFDSLPKAYLACGWLQEHSRVNLLVMNDLQRKLIQTVCPMQNNRFIMFKGTSSFKGVFGSYFDGGQFGMGVIPPKSMRPLGSQMSKGSDVVYIPRKKGKPRSVINEEDIIQLMKQIWPSLKVFFPSENWENDRQIFGNAKIIIGPHGGAFSNMIFAPINTTIVEFLPLIRLMKERKNARPCYFGLANGLGFRYHSVDVEGFSFNAPMKVSIEKLRKEIIHINS